MGAVVGSLRGQKSFASCDFSAIATGVDDLTFHALAATRGRCGTDKTRPSTGRRPITGLGYKDCLYVYKNVFGICVCALRRL